MRAAVTADGGAFEIRTVPDPEPGPNDVVIRVRASGVCGSDLKALPFMPPGTIMGHEFAGEVVDAGEGVVGLPVGAMVAALLMTSCGLCHWCTGGNVAHCASVEFLGINRPGGFAEYAVLSAAHTFPLAAGVSADLGALVEPFTVGLHAAAAAGVTTGDDVLVVGAGTVGLTMTAWARERGAKRVTAIDPARGRRELAMKLGATDTVAAVAETEPSAYDVVAECVGNEALLDACTTAARPLGRIVVLGICGEPDQFLRVAAVLKELTVHFSVGYLASEFTRVTDAFASGRIDPRPMLGRGFGLEGTADAFEHAASGLDGKVLVHP